MMRLCALGFCWLLVLGCGKPDRIKITGKLTKKGEPIAVNQKMLVTLTFAPEPASAGQPHPAEFDFKTSTFAVELAPGKYTPRLVMQDHNKTPPAMISVSKAFMKTVLDLNEPKDLTLDIDP